ncbi:hypothetical protein HGM15179_017819 [Zosterops borbonicus]|uniref:Uncharacterized protein n=1 Tax=Zosterops borbonicus TaxID=364589 RepID=A0A8K1G048_9PASS|nr:hypothetical protein HGM15179_017819 [Zosterops borbonicus]
MSRGHLDPSWTFWATLTPCETSWTTMSRSHLDPFCDLGHMDLSWATWTSWTPPGPPGPPYQDLTSTRISSPSGSYLHQDLIQDLDSTRISPPPESHLHQDLTYTGISPPSTASSSIDSSTEIHPARTQLH